MQRTRLDDHWAVFFSRVERIRASLSDGACDEVDLRHEIANVLQIMTTLFELEMRRPAVQAIGA